MQICQKLENETNCTRGSFFASLLHVACNIPHTCCLGQRSDLKNKNHLSFSAITLAVKKKKKKKKLYYHSVNLGPVYMEWGTPV